MLSDHHLLVLEAFSFETKAWYELANLQCEALSESFLIAWLSKFPELKRASIALILNDELFRFVPVSDGLEENNDEAFVDHDEVEAVILNKVSVLPYLQAFKALRIKLQSISPANHQELNLLPWREAKARRQKYRKIGMLSLFPLLVLALSLSLQNQVSSKLEAAQVQNQNLNRTLNLISPNKSAISLNQMLPMIEGLLQQGKGLEALSINSNGELNLSGLSTENGSLHEMLNRFAGLPQIREDSMHDWSVHQTKSGASWSVSFSLRSGS